MHGKRNGLSWPLHPLQVATWAVGAFQLGGGYGIVGEKLEREEQVAFWAGFALAAIGTVGFAVAATLSDPTDPVVYEHRRCLQDGYPSLSTPFNERQYSRVCTSCQTNVSDNSKHCAQCNRCVVGFDHHCKWLNNCVGERNYRWFAGAIASVSVAEGIVIGFGVRALIENYGKTSETVDIAQTAVLSFLILLSAVIFVVDLHLIIFHIWLRSKGLTTYEFTKSKKKATVASAAKAEGKSEPPPLLISTVHEDLKPRVAPGEEYNLAAELRPVSCEESSYSLSEGVSVSRVKTPEHELL